MTRTSTGWATYQLMHNRLSGSAVNSRGHKDHSEQARVGKGLSFKQKDAYKNAAVQSAIRDLRRRLADGQWRKKSVVGTVAEKYGVPLDSLRRLAGIFESDSTKWVCVLTDDTPDLAPDER